MNSNEIYRGEIEEDAPKIPRSLPSSSSSVSSIELPDFEDDIKSTTTVSQINHRDGIKTPTQLPSSMEPPPASFVLESNDAKKSSTTRETNTGRPLSSMNALTKPESKPFLVSGHVIFCSLSPTFPANLAYFIAPFRQKRQSPIVILSPGEPDEEEWAQLQTYNNVHHVI
jgi:hypothetical protein